MLKNGREQAFSTRFNKQAVDFDALLIVYEVEKGEWRGFVHPYGESIDGDSKEEVISKLRDLTDSYYETLKRYDFPSHLVQGGLVNEMDRYVFSWVVGNKSFMSQIHSKAGKADSTYCYVEAYRHKA